MNSAKAMGTDKSKVIDILLDDIEIKEILLKELTNDYERSGSIGSLPNNTSPPYPFRPEICSSISRACPLG